MAFSQKTVYALRAVFELAKYQKIGPVAVPHLAKAQAIPPRFLENILIQLKQSEIVESIRGKHGGYILAKPAEEVMVGDVLRAIEGNIEPVSCLGDSSQATCPMRDNCVFRPMWQEALDASLAVYDGTSIGDLVEKSAQNAQSYIVDYCI